MSETLEILQDNLGKALWDTFFMVGVATLVGVVLGTALAVLLYLTQHRLFTPNHAVNEMVGFVVNAIRSMPFLILLVVLIPLIQLLIGDPYTPTGGAIALSIAAVPFFARVAESAFQEVDEGLLEAAISTGAPLRQIIFGRFSRRRCPAIFAALCSRSSRCSAIRPWWAPSVPAALAIWPFNTATTVMRPACSSPLCCCSSCSYR